MISKKDVVTMRIPFPKVNSPLANIPHMYVCMQDGNKKQMVTCQSKKPEHLKKGSLPSKRIEEKPDVNRNPFQRISLIDCDKVFSIDDVEIHSDLLTSTRPNVCNQLYDDIRTKINEQGTVNEKLNRTDIVVLNRKMRSLV